MSEPLSHEQMRADIAFLLLRAGCAGSCNFGEDRWTGMSSNALVSLAYGGEQDDMPADRSDWAACIRTYRRLPPHRKTAAVRAGLAAAREAYLTRYPEHQNAASRRSAREAQRREQEAWAASRLRGRRRRA